MSTASTLALISILALCSCSDSIRQSDRDIPPAAHVVGADGTPVAGTPEPEVVRLLDIETVNNEKHVTVGNAAGDYVLVCVEQANDSENQVVQSCLSPRPQQDYLLFREKTEWLINGAKTPITLGFMQDWSVKYNRGENVGLLPAHKSEGEQFGVYWLLSWKGKSPGH